jgi:prepilin-type processing-associated H-X9-DG protein
VRSDYFLSSIDLNACWTLRPIFATRYGVPHELSGLRWGDGSLFYTRYNHLFPPNRASCLLGSTTDDASSIVVTASSRHPGGVNLATADGAVHFVKDGVDPDLWHGLGTIAGGEAVSNDSDY